MKLHTSALERFRITHTGRSLLDVERANVIATLRAAYPKAKIVAFAQYTETVSTLFRRLGKLGGVAMLIANGARVAGGKLSRGEALSRFAPRALNAPPPAVAERIDILLSTDLLSEGVNLQDAEVVVHLDIPWTAARLEQRVGRVARMGSDHSEVGVYLIRPPASAAALLENEILVQRKWDIARRAVGSANSPPFPDQSSVEVCGAAESVASRTERLRAILDAWRRPIAQLHSDDVWVASVSSPRSGFVAVVTVDGKLRLVVRLSGKLSSDLESQIIACGLGNGIDVQTNRSDCDAAMQHLSEWADCEAASVLAGLGDSSALRRRRLVNRIDAAIESAPPQSRRRRLTIAAKARRAAAAQQSAAIEAELESLAAAPLSDDEWLAAVAKLEPSQRASVNPPKNTHGIGIHALLILCGDASRQAQCLQPSSVTAP